jgi:hypothetical protein
MNWVPLKLGAGFGTEHPERAEGELFIGYSDLTGFTCSAWESKRRGTQVIDTDGVNITDLVAGEFFPVFMQAVEFHNSMDRSQKAA